MYTRLISYWLRCIGIATLMMTINNLELKAQLPGEEQKQATFSVNRKTYLILRRFYTINRLSHIIEKIKKIDPKETQSTSTINFDNIIIDSKITSDKKVKNHTSAQELRPLLADWDKFSSYQSLEDIIFIERLTKEIYIVTIGFLNQFSALKTTCRNHNKIDISYLATIDDIATRLYHIERLNKAMAYLEQKSLPASPVLMDQFDKKLSFSTNEIKKCVSKINTHKNLTPLINEWKNFKQYRNLSNQDYETDLFKCIFVAFKNIAFNHLKAIPEEYLAYFQGYTVIDSFDQEEVLSEIDLLFQETQYLKNASSKTFSFLKKTIAPSVLIGLSALYALSFYI